VKPIVSFPQRDSWENILEIFDAIDRDTILAEILQVIIQRLIEGIQLGQAMLVMLLQLLDCQLDALTGILQTEIMIFVILNGMVKLPINRIQYFLTIMNVQPIDYLANHVQSPLVKTFLCHPRSIPAAIPLEAPFPFVPEPIYKHQYQRIDSFGAAENISSPDLATHKSRYDRNTGNDKLFAHQLPGPNLARYARNWNKIGL
jgi:hypothetical protein